MYKILISILILLASSNLYGEDAKQVSLELKPNKVVSTYSDKDMLEITNKETGKKWSLSKKEFDILYKSYKNWRTVESTEPVIKEILDDDNYVYIIFGYYDKSEKDFLGFKISKKEKSVLSGKVLIHKKYLITSKSKKNDTYKYMLIGTASYSVLMTILLFILVVAL